MNGSEFAQICVLVLVLLSCIAWIAYSEDKYDKKIKALNDLLADKEQLLFLDDKLNKQFRQDYWDRLRLDANNRIGSETGMFSADSAKIADAMMREIDIKRPSAAGE